MMGDRNKPSLALWVTAVLLSLPLFYVVALGPCCWTSSRWGDGTTVTRVYRPVTRIIDASNSARLEAAFRWYSNLFASWRFDWCQPGSAGNDDRWRWKDCVYEKLSRTPRNL